MVLGRPAKLFLCIASDLSVPQAELLSHNSVLMCFFPLSSQVLVSVTAAPFLLLSPSIFQSLCLYPLYSEHLVHISKHSLWHLFPALLHGSSQGLIVLSCKQNESQSWVFQ